MATSPLVHVKRALGWNLAKVLPSPEESAGLVAAGVVDPAVQRYAAWRKSLLLVALVPTLVAFILAVIDLAEEDLGDYTTLGIGIEALWLGAAAMLPLACILGARSWKRPGASAALLRAAWGAAFILPFVYALLPAGLRVHIQDAEEGAGAGLAGVVADHVQLSADQLEKLHALQNMALDLVLSGGAYLLLLPAVLSLIPGAVNGCLRIKALLPAAQLPGWLLVSAAPAFLLFWLVILVIANHAAQSALLVFGVLLWAGSPIWFSLQGRVFVQAQITDADAAKIGAAKRRVGLFALTGLATMLAFVVTTKVAGLHIAGLDAEAAVSTRLDELNAQDDVVTLDDVRTAFAESKSFIYALDLSIFRMVIDVLAKLLIVTAVFADLILRATLSAWKNDRSLRSNSRASDFDASAAAAVAALSPAGSPPPS